MLIKLTALQSFRQESHLAIEDELLNFFLEDSATAGAGSDKDFRRKLRNETIHRVGFDPYDESPVKRRGEEYIARARARAEGDASGDELDRSMSSPPPDFARQSIEQTCSTCGSPRSSPSRLVVAQGTPSKLSTPPTLRPPGAAYRNGISIGLPRMGSQGSLLATPPSTTKSRQDVLRAQSEPMPSSPLAKEFRHDDEEEDE